LRSSGTCSRPIAKAPRRDVFATLHPPPPESDCAAILVRMTLLRPRVDALLPVPAVAPRPPLVHVPA
jgi:hypothetical protein